MSKSVTIDKWAMRVTEADRRKAAALQEVDLFATAILVVELMSCDGSDIEKLTGYGIAVMELSIERVKEQLANPLPALEMPEGTELDRNIWLVALICGWGTRWPLIRKRANQMREKYPTSLLYHGT